MKKIYLAALALLMLCGCRKEVTVNDFLKTVSANSVYKKEVVSGDFILTAVYRPAELICLSELCKEQGNYRYNAAQFSKELKNYSNGCYMDVTIRMKSGENAMTKNVRNQEEYAARLGSLTYLFARDCYMIADEKDTIHALSCNFSNTYSNSPDIKMIMVFPAKKIAAVNNSLDLVYDDKTFGVAEKLVLNYDAAEIKKQVPAIKE